MPNDYDRRIAETRQLTLGQIAQFKALRGFTNAALTEMPEAVLTRVVRRFEYPDLPRQRALFRYRQARDERRQVRANALGRATRQLRTVRAKSTKARLA